jgi:FMN-dependent NADH-azoreductase
MPLLLHIHASPKGPLSTSLRLAQAFLAEVQRLEPETDVQHLDLFEAELPEFGRDAALAKFAPIYGYDRTEAQEKLWDEVRARIAEFAAADRILLSTPMWNYSIPYRLKHYLDIIMQPRETMGFDARAMQHFGLLTNRPVQFILTRSSVLPGDHGDFQLPYLKFSFESIGLRDISVLSAWRTTQASAEARENYVVSFEEQARSAAAAFLTRPLPKTA